MTTSDVLQAVKDRYGITLLEISDANGYYLEGRLEGGLWVVATDAEGQAMRVCDRVREEMRDTCECCGDYREPLGLGWSVGIYRNCVQCGDDHPACHDEDGCLSDFVEFETVFDGLPTAIGSVLRQFVSGSTMVGSDIELRNFLSGRPKNRAIVLLEDDMSDHETH